MTSFATGCKCTVEKPLAIECLLHGNGCEHEWSAARRGVHECLKGCGATLPWSRSGYSKHFASQSDRGTE